MTLLELTAGILMLSSATVGTSSSAQSTAPTVPMNPDSKSDARYIDMTNREQMAKYVKEYFARTPILAEVARCESMYRQVGLDGEVMHGNVDPRDIGIMQINQHYHSKTAQALGLDLTTLEGNLAYAKYLYAKQGLDPWRSSEQCWSKTQAYKDLRDSNES